MNPKHHFRNQHSLTPEERLDHFTDILAEAIVKQLIGNQEQKSDTQPNESGPPSSVEKSL